MSGTFYLQDSRSFVGNDVLWWAKGFNGYTTDLSKAEKFTKDDAVRMHQARRSDIPWPCAYIDARTRPAVDFQYIKRAEALEGTGIVIEKEPKQTTQRYRCQGCGVFISDADYYGGRCPKCGADNRP